MSTDADLRGRLVPKTRSETTSRFDKERNPPTNPGPGPIQDRNYQPMCETRVTTRQDLTSIKSCLVRALRDRSAGPNGRPVARYPLLRRVEDTRTLAVGRGRCGSRKSSRLAIAKSHEIREMMTMALAHITLATRDVRRSRRSSRGAGLAADRAARQHRPAGGLAVDRAGRGAASDRGPRVRALAVRARVRPAHRRDRPAVRVPGARGAAGARVRRSSTPSATRRSGGSSSATPTAMSSRS